MGQNKERINEGCRQMRVEKGKCGNCGQQKELPCIVFHKGKSIKICSECIPKVMNEVLAK